MSELGKRGNNTMQITEAFKRKTLVITGGTGSFA
jgi:FlaA1/EpsC-like NDP-sugar epimerase